MLRRFLLFLSVVIAVFFIAGLALSFVLNTPSITEKYLTSLLNKNLKGYTVKRCSIGRQEFSYPNELIFSDVVLSLGSQKETYDLQVRQLSVDGLKGLLGRKTLLNVHAQEFSVKSGSITSGPSAIDVVVVLADWKLKDFNGIFKVPYVEAYKYRVMHIDGKITGNIQSILFDNIKAESYKGKMTGKILLDWKKDVTYSMKAGLNGLDLKQLKDVNPSAYSQIEGVLNGSVSIQGNVKQFTSVDLKAEITKDGKLNAALLQFVIPYIPRTQETALFEAMIKNGQKVPVEIALMELRSVDSHKLSGFVKLLVGKLNLDLNLPVDILYDGNLYSLVEWYQKLSK